MSTLWSPLSETYGQSRAHLHQLAFYAISPARQRAVGRMGLRPTPRGFGTPPFEDRVARVEGTLLVHEKQEEIATQTFSTIRSAAVFFGGTYEEVWFDGFRDPLAPVDPDSPVVVDDGDSHLIGEWFGFAFEILGRLGDRGQDDDVSEPQIWPEHFDAAIELGSASDGRRASYGFSPGDGVHLEPYIYVAAWGDIDRSNPYWNDDAFNGSSLGYAELAASSPDPADPALAFFERGYQILRSR